MLFAFYCNSTLKYKTKKISEEKREKPCYCLIHQLQSSVLWRLKAAAFMIVSLLDHYTNKKKGIWRKKDKNIAYVRPIHIYIKIEKKNVSMSKQIKKEKGIYLANDCANIEIYIYISYPTGHLLTTQVAVTGWRMEMGFERGLAVE